jgi:hypothetical protein
MSHLYAIYVGVYADATDLFADGWAAPDIELGDHADPSAIERAVASLALLDATNGTPLRSRAQFERMAEDSSPMLHRLELCERG